MEDYTLIGHFNLLRLFLVYKPTKIEFSTLAKLVMDLLQGCLLNLRFEALDSDVTDALDIKSHEKTVISKCLTRESIASCFQLLVDAMQIAYLQHADKGGHELLK